MADRVSLNVRVSRDVKEAFDSAVADEYGTADSYAGFVLERELRAELGQGHITTLREAVEDLAETIDDTAREKDENQSTPEYFSGRDGDTTVVRYRVSEDVRDAIEKRQTNAFRSSGEFVEAVMRRYAETDGEIVRIAETVTELTEELVLPDDDGMSKTERIASRLGETFTKREFLDAAEKEGIGTTKYALEEYLPDVLDAKDVVPATGASETFVPQGGVSDSGSIDPSRLPYHAMTEKEKRIAIKAEALRELNNQAKGRLTPADGCSLLGGRPNHSTVQSLFRDIARESPDNGFSYNDGCLEVDGEQAKEADWDNETSLQIVGHISDKSEDEQPEDATQISTAEKEADKQMEELQRAVPASEGPGDVKNP